MSRRNIQRFIEDSHGIKISLGAISSLEHRISSGLRTAHAEAMTSVASSATKHLDETTWRQSSRLAWLWTAVGEDATVFVIRDSRASSVARELIGDEPNGIIISDRYSGYSYIDFGSAPSLPRPLAPRFSAYGRRRRVVALDRAAVARLTEWCIPTVGTLPR